MSGLAPSDPALIHQPFWFLRHGETDWNQQNLAQGDTEVALNDNGRAQARAAAALVPGRGISSIVASTLGRARETAMVAADALGLPVSLDDQLREAEFGVRDRTPMLGETWFDDWVHGRATPDGAESFANLRARARRAVNAALAKPPLVLIVAHGALFRALRAEMGLAPDVRTANGMPILCRPPAAPDGPWVLEPAIPGGSPV